MRARTTIFTVAKNNKVLVDKGLFKCMGKLAYPVQARFIINDTIGTDLFFVEPGKILANITFDSLNNLSVNVISITNYEFKNDYQLKMNRVLKEFGSWDNTYLYFPKNENNKFSSSIEDSMQYLRRIIEGKGDSILYTYIKNHNKSYVSLWELYNKVSMHGYNQILNSSYYYLDKKLQKTITGISIKRILDVQKKIAIGSIFPKMPVRDHLGKMHSIQGNKLRKYTLIDFWHSHCGPCILQFPELQRIYEAYKPFGFEILGVSIDVEKNRGDWLNAIKINNLSWPQYWDVNYIQTTKLLGITFVPFNFLLDADGEIIAKNLEPFQVEDFLKKRYNQ